MPLTCALPRLSAEKAEMSQKMEDFRSRCETNVQEEKELMVKRASAALGSR